MARLVVVDDDDTMRNWLAAVLRAARHEVRAYASAEEALPAIHADLPDLVIADIRMPGKSGLEMLESLRASAATRALPLILATSVGDRKTYRAGMELGADDFITKPMSSGDLTRAVEARLARAHAASAAGRINGLAPDSEGEPASIGRFKVVRQIARGLGTAVYLARDTTGQEVAVKLLRDLAPVDGIDMLKRFLKEIEMAGAVRHPHLAAVIDSGISDGGPYVAFEYFPLGDLARMLSRGIAPNLACRIVSQVAAGLAALHQAGIVHRDIKPANIMVRNAGSFALTDFGTAKTMRIDTSFTPGGRIIGTPSYLAPEQITRKTLGPPTDIYSLGILFQELLTGEKVFNGADYHQVLHAHLTETPPALPARLKAFQPVLDRMLAKNPQSRFPDAAALLQALDRLAY
ncbi:MAG: protein kinase [Burkholderiales bacterium]|nr:protein kinase [Burkholderiales bacterium]